MTPETGELEPNQYPWLAAVVLAAGQSRRMGQPKQLLSWGNHTVIEQVVISLLVAGVGDIVVVTGRMHTEVEGILIHYPVRTVHNPQYAATEMMRSLKIGISSLDQQSQALLVVLGDQPMLQAETVRVVVDGYQRTGARLVVPSYQMHRGHPWLVSRGLWPDLLALPEEKTLRDFLNANNSEIFYVEVDRPDILKDMDTPEDYHKLRPQG